MRQEAKLKPKAARSKSTFSTLLANRLDQELNTVYRTGQGQASFEAVCQALMNRENNQVQNSQLLFSFQPSLWYYSCMNPCSTPRTSLRTSDWLTMRPARPTPPHPHQRLASSLPSMTTSSPSSSLSLVLHLSPPLLLHRPLVALLPCSSCGLQHLQHPSPAPSPGMAGIQAEITGVR